MAKAQPGEVLGSFGLEARAAALEAARGKPATAALIAALSREHGEEAARWAIGQWELRAKATEKFGLAQDMFFTREGLEMATTGAIAAWHASRFPAGEPVADLTCGIGADLIALAKRGPATGIDLSAEHVWCAARNLEAHGIEASVVCSECVDWFWANRPDLVMIDPARRDGSGRKHRAEDYSPDWESVVGICEAARKCLVKLSPMLPDQVLERISGRLSFVSYGGQCREACIETGAGQWIWAVHVESGESLERRELADRRDMPEAVIFEADPAAIRAHALGSFGLCGLGDADGYLTSESLISSVWLRAFEVLWSGPFRAKSVAKALHDLDMGLAAVKVRGVRLDPVSVKRQIGQGRSSRAAELIVWPVGEKVKCAVVTRVANGPQ